MADAPLHPGGWIRPPPEYFAELKTDPHERSQWLLQAVVEHDWPHKDLAQRLLASVVDANPTALKSALVEVSAVVLTTEDVEWLAHYEIVLPEDVLPTPPPNPVTWSYNAYDVVRGPNPLAPGWEASQLIRPRWPQDYLWSQEMIVICSIEWWMQLWRLALNPTPALDQTLRTIDQVQVAELFTKHRHAYYSAIDTYDGINDPDDLPSAINDLYPFLREMLNGPAPFRYDLFACVYNFGALFPHNKVPLHAAFFDMDPFTVQPLVTSATASARVVTWAGSCRKSTGV